MSPNGYTGVADITLVGDIPDQYRVKLRVTLNAGMDRILYADETYGRRIAINTNFQQGVDFTNALLTLEVDDVPVVSESGPAACGGSSPCAVMFLTGNLTLALDHPYAANGGTYADQVVTKAVDLTVPVAILAGYGQSSPALVTKWADEASDKQLPAHGAFYNCAATQCYAEYASSAGDATRQKMAASWLAQASRMFRLQGALGASTIEHHHSLGVVSWRYNMSAVKSQYTPPGTTGTANYGIADQYLELNIDTALSVTSNANNQTRRNAVSRAVAAAAATLEGSVVEQMQDLPDTASTASRFAWANQPDEDPCNSGARSFYDFTGSTSASRANLVTYEGSVAGCGVQPIPSSPDVGGWRQRLDDALSGYLAAGFHVTAPGESWLGPGWRVGQQTSYQVCKPGSGGGQVCSGYNEFEISRQRGGAIVATRTDSFGQVAEIAHVLTNRDGMSKGGGGNQPDLAATYDPKKAADLLKDRFVDRGVRLGVDVKSGAAGYQTPTLLSVGQGEAPYRLDYSLAFKSAPSACDAFGPCVGPIQGGWTHNWDLRFAVSGSGMEAMGGTSPRAAAGSLAAFLAMQDIFADPSRSDLEKDVYATLAADWWRRQMVFNAATLTQGFQGKQYVRLVDGSWMAPLGAPGALLQSGQRVKARNKCSNLGEQTTQNLGRSASRIWDQSGVNFSLRNAGGDTLSVAPWSWAYSTFNTCGVLYGFQINSWIWPQGVALTFDHQPWGEVTAVHSNLGLNLSFIDRSQTTNVNGASSSGLSAAQPQNPATPITDASGASWTFGYNAPLSRSATQRPVRYQQLAHVYEPVNGSQAALEYGYDSRGLVKSAKDADALQLGSRGAYTWFIAEGGRGERVDPLGGAYAVYYDTDGRAVRHIDELGRETDSVYDGRGRVVSRTYPEGDQDRFGYDGADNVIRLTKSAKPGSGLSDLLVEAGYDPTWNKPAWIRDAKGQQTDLTYVASGGGAGEIATATRPAVGGSRPIYSFTYNGFGQLLTATDPTGLVTSNTYDANNYLASTRVNPGGVAATTSFTNNAVGDVTVVDGPRTDVADVSYATYDAMRRKVFEIAPAPTAGAARLISKTTYDALGRTIQVDKGVGVQSDGSDFSVQETTTTAYDPAGNKIKDVTPAGVTQYAYDGADRLLCTAVRMNPAAYNTLPDACSLSAVGSSGADRIAQTIYDAAGQTLQTLQALGTARQRTYATYTYSPNGKQTSVKDANGNLTSLVYDGFDRLTQQIFPSTTRGAGVSNPADYEAYGYDANGNRTSLRKRDGKTFTYDYDALNREIVKHSPDGPQADVYTGYDLAGRKLYALYASIGGSGITYSYDTAGRMTSETTFGRSMSFQYDPASNRTRITWPDGNSATFGYYANTNMGATYANGQIYTAYGYDGLSRRTGLARSTGANTAYGYDQANRLISLSHDPSGTANDVSWGFTYSPANQVLSRSLSNPLYAWSGYPSGTKNTTADGLNRDADIAAVAGGYDANGNLTFDGTRTFTYDAENRLTSVSGVAGQPAMTLSYDPNGRLWQTSAGGSVTQFVYDGDRLTAEYDGAGNVLRRYLHGSGVDEPLVWWEGSGVTSGNARFLHADRQGSIIAWSDGGATSPRPTPMAPMASRAAGRDRGSATPARSPCRRRSSTTTRPASTTRSWAGSCRPIPSDIRTTWTSTPT